MGNYAFYATNGNTIESAPLVDTFYSKPDGNVNTGPWAVEYEKATPTIFNAAAHFNNAWTDIVTDMQHVTQGYRQEEQDPYIADILNNCSFIWGNIEDGGLAVAKVYTSGPDRASFVWFQGKQTYEDGVTVKYPAYWGGTAGYSDIPIGKLGQCFVATDMSFEGSISIVYAFNDDGTCEKLKCNPVYQDPLSDLIIGYSYASDGNKTVSECVCNEYYHCFTPQYPVDLNYTYMPQWGFGNLGFTYPVSPITPGAGWSGDGSWYGGDGNLSTDAGADAGIAQPSQDENDFYNDSDNVHQPDFDDLLGTDAINSGFLTIYNPDKGKIKDFNDFLFAGITEDMSAVLKRLVSSPLDYVVSLSMIHYQPAVSNIDYEIKFCGLPSGVSAPVVLNQFQEIDCGAVKVPEAFHSALDYGGYTRVKIAVPYCGVYPINTDDLLGGEAKGTYRIDLLTGNCTFTLAIKRKMRSDGDTKDLDDDLYFFTGNCINSLPLSATDWRGLFQGSCQVAAGIASLATGNVAGGAASVANGVMAMKPDVIKSGNLATTYGYLGCQKPYFILERPVQNMPSHFGEYKGYPSNIYRQVKSCSGYTEVDETTFWTMRIHGTDEEMNEIKELMYSGVYL